MWDNFATQAAGAGPGAAFGALIGGIFGWPMGCTTSSVDEGVVRVICKNQLIEWSSPPDEWEVFFFFVAVGAAIGFVLGLIVDYLKRMARG